MRNEPYFDFHVHTSRSDAAPSQTPEAVVKAAAEAGISRILITDHDRELPAALCRRLTEAYGVDVIGGVELNASLTLSTGRRINAHIVAPWLPAELSPEMTAVLATNQGQDFEGYTKAMLRKLLLLGVDPSGAGVNESWEMIKAATPDTLHRGKNALAHLLTDTGWCESPREAKEVYLSAFGHRLAYVSSHLYHHYAGLEEVMAAVNSVSFGILAHLFYYQLNERENEELLERFKALGGVGLEVDYGRYSPEKKEILARYAREYDLLPSAGSDRHEPDDDFKEGDPAWYEALRTRFIELHGERPGL